MALTKIKICGIKTMADVLAMNEVKPDYAGFVFAQSSRRISEELASELQQQLAPGIVPVGVFVNEDREKILRLCKRKIIEIIQLHGEEDNEYIAFLKNRVQNPVIKAARVRSVEDIHRAGTLKSEYLLLDAYHEGEYGGSGVKFDWSLIPAIEKPFFLAGGINSSNVLDAIQRYQPYGIDVSTGVETEGSKDPVKLRRLAQLIRDIGEG